MKTNILNFLLISTIALLLGAGLKAQTITGAWRGKIRNAKVEVKLIKLGDSLLGTSYYYSSARHYRRYSIRGYFDAETNDVIWWDDQLLDEDGIPVNRHSADAGGYLSVADFNCPGEDRMKLEGNSSEKNSRSAKKQPLNMQKVGQTDFPDEWDYILDNYFVGANDRRLIDSISKIRMLPFVDPEQQEIATVPDRDLISAHLPDEGRRQAIPEPEITVPSKIISPEPAKDANSNKFTSREKLLQTVIPITANEIELRFYDNAQIDGDSIALFLNGRMIAEHIFLTDKPYTIRLDQKDLSDDNELVMVAENLGSIPPNTSFMVAIVGKKRYEARLFANEKSSALVRFVKPSKSGE